MKRHASGEDDLTDVGKKIAAEICEQRLFVDNAKFQGNR